ncbi:hypothetical protein HGRIS_012991 [Hohenbuehelia grisea]|uniref:Zn(2)-C6 fungal-type domain-containing protein n=1 Tax=Hohenbuehelia grisea TaxID=104357 RepID=A0ABR3IU49_9AGAR
MFTTTPLTTTPLPPTVERNSTLMASYSGTDIAEATAASVPLAHPDFNFAPVKFGDAPTIGLPGVDQYAQGGVKESQTLDSSSASDSVAKSVPFGTAPNVKPFTPKFSVSSANLSVPSKKGFQPRQRARTPQACNACRTRKTKCTGERPICTRCSVRGIKCEYHPSPYLRTKDQDQKDSKQGRRPKREETESMLLQHENMGMFSLSAPVPPSPNLPGQAGERPAQLSFSQRMHPLAFIPPTLAPRFSIIKGGLTKRSLGPKCNPRFRKCLKSMASFLSVRPTSPSSVASSPAHIASHFSSRPSPLSTTQSLPLDLSESYLSPALSPSYASSSGSSSSSCAPSPFLPAALSLDPTMTPGMESAETVQAIKSFNELLCDFLNAELNLGEASTLLDGPPTQ